MLLKLLTTTSLMISTKLRIRIVSASTNASTAMIKKAVLVLLNPLADRDVESRATAAEIHAASSISFLMYFYIYYIKLNN